MTVEPQSLVSLVHREDMEWDTLPSETGAIRISRPFGSKQSPTLGGGLLEIEGAEMPWTPNYDEMVVVLDGEMIIRHNGVDLTAKAGDMYLIRYGADIVYKSQSKATIAWILYPATWRNLRWPE